MPKQGELKGVEAPKIKAIEEAADSYVEVRDKRNKLTERVKETRKALIESLHEHEGDLSVRPDGTLVYRYGDSLVELKPRAETVAIKAVKLDEGETEAEGD